MAVENLGQVGVFFKGTTSPSNTDLIWLDTNTTPGVFKTYDPNLADWVSIVAGTNEEDTFTPDITGSTSNPTVGYSVQTGSFEKDGNYIEVDIHLELNSYSGGSGDVLISLPETALTYDAVGSCMVRNVTWATSREMLVPYIDVSADGDNVGLVAVDNGGGSTDLDVTGLSSTSRIWIHIRYKFA